MAQTTLNGKVRRNQLGDVYNRSGHALDQCPIAALDQIGSFSGYQYEVDTFTNYAGPATGGEGGGWNLADTGTSVVALEVGDLVGGTLKIQTGGTEDNSAILQRTITGAPWEYVVGKRMWCFAKFNLSDANDAEAFFGLTTPSAVAAMGTMAEVLALDDGIYFEKAETATEFDFHVRKNDVSTEATLVSATFADGVAQILGFVVEADGDVKAYGGTTLENLVEIASVTAGAATLPNDVGLALTFGIETGAGAAKDMTVEWYFVAQEI